ncbi:biosynthetic-type acetolactate synthase large subunit [Taylorella equigenitalis]|uniref:Acetolactate synthase n=2 Tax=Taylorella equigenitalis TaxID=29575 RepID=A0A654KFI3_TAYEM|nr:biosynthetic-type acetolactate synthase large subunit [Taylorella equigenitalis]ADU91149.1 Acetolactate synthase large subunit [Taylorella equigenitalis MCE9]AFN36254.1 acetolactate synthase isozyme III large subunit [Taylorella equigenitalis ATCC 35865]ASY38126.1 acetolactate synthase, large subunit, biosynthetic type [Taylorella equigenitalis]ASY39653.1 acetolactate synthase, large subunit, biosynthetic type [Taylorella equigenitalis]ASY41105.1 acetolactate synthase, large subunit, biosyn
MELIGAEILVECLAEQGVKHVFGYPGGAVLYIYDAIHKQNHFEHILVRHEQAAVHAADAYARVSNRVGVCVVTSGPGLTNAVTGIATAHMDSIPLVVISGQVGSKLIGEDAFQECDAIGITRPCVKHNFLVSDVRDLADIVRKAFHIARTGRPGPVLIDIPKDISMTPCKFMPAQGEVKIRSYNPVVKGHSGQIKKAAQIIASAQRPYILAGGGAITSNSTDELTELVSLTNAPCALTLMGLGAVRADNKNYVGMPGMHGTVEANLGLHNCDVLIAVGSRLDDRIIGNVKNYNSLPRKVIHIDVDPSSISKRIKADVPIVGDVREVLLELNGLLSEEGKFSEKYRSYNEQWWKQIDEWRARQSLTFDRESEIIKPQYVIETLCKMTGGDAYVTSDVGQHQMWTAQYYRFNQPRHWVNSGGLGTMGVGLPYAMGVLKAHPDATVACITGEGSIQMNIQELATCKQYGLNPKIICLNNRYLGMVRQWQELEYSKRYSQSYMESLPDFIKLAEAYGHIGMTIERTADVEPALREAFGKYKDRLVFMNFITDRDENVWPMVQAGKGLSEMLLSPAHAREVINSSKSGTVSVSGAK